MATSTTEAKMISLAHLINATEGYFLAAAALTLVCQGSLVSTGAQKLANPIAMHRLMDR